MAKRTAADLVASNSTASPNPTNKTGSERPAPVNSSAAQLSSNNPQTVTTTQGKSASMTPVPIPNNSKHQDPLSHLKRTIPTKRNADGNVPMSETPPAKLVKTQSDLFTSGRFADVVVECGDREWKLHRSVLCLGCEFFNMAFAMKEEIVKIEDADQAAADAVNNAKLPVIELTVDSTALNGVLHYIYTLDTSRFKPFSLETIDINSVFTVHLHPTYKIWILAHEYSLPDLTAAARDHFQWLIQVTLSKFGEFSKTHRSEWTSWILMLWDRDTDGAVLLKKDVLNTMSRLRLDVWNCSEIEDLMMSNVSFATAMANVCQSKVSQMQQGQTMLQAKVQSLEAKVRMLENQEVEYLEKAPMVTKGGKGR